MLILSSGGQGFRQRNEKKFNGETESTSLLSRQKGRHGETRRSNDEQEGEMSKSARRGDKDGIGLEVCGIFTRRKVLSAATGRKTTVLWRIVVTRSASLTRTQRTLRLYRARNEALYISTCCVATRFSLLYRCRKFV